MKQDKNLKALKRAYKDYLKVVNDDISFHRFIAEIESVTQ